jgi:hypothetical protein
MGEILGLGATHYPLLAGPDEHMANPLRFLLRQAGFPEEYRSPERWPEEMRQEWGGDEGATAAARHRERLVGWFRRLRSKLDEFRPDLVVIWGDDQYENFREDIIPPFCILAYDQIVAKPWGDEGIMRLIGGRNIWGEGSDFELRVPGHRPAAKYLATRLLEEGFDTSYAYKPLHHELGHAFVNTILFLDYDRKGWIYPVIPFQVNCYGRLVVSQRGGLPDLSKPVTEEQMDPPSPAPWRCFELGRAVARALMSSPWRVALIASSSWSHAFLTAKTHWLHPDIEADRKLYDALREGRYDYWREYTLGSVEESGQQEILNWMCLVGAMAELGRRPSESEMITTYIFNSSKVFAIFAP